MNPGLLALLILIGVLVALKLLARFLLVRFARRVGQQAITTVPDQIHLTPKTDHAWTDRAAVEALAAPLASLGFVDAGTYRIDALAGMTVRLLAQPEQRVAAAIYEHPKAGTWMDFFSHYSDDTSITYSTMRSTALDRRPDAKTVHAPDSGSEPLYQRMLRERPAGNLKEMTPATVIHRFEEAYARAAAWRKNKGVSSEEVLRHIRQRASDRNSPSVTPSDMSGSCANEPATTSVK